MKSNLSNKIPYISHYALNSMNPARGVCIKTCEAKFTTWPEGPMVSSVSMALQGGAAMKRSWGLTCNLPIDYTTLFSGSKQVPTHIGVHGWFCTKVLDATEINHYGSSISNNIILQEAMRNCAVFGWIDSAQISVSTSEHAICSYYAILLSGRTCYSSWLSQTSLQKCSALLCSSQQFCSGTSSISNATPQPDVLALHNKVSCSLAA